MDIVRTFTGAWIETAGTLGVKLLRGVRTFTGAWIETKLSGFNARFPSFAPSQGRGLKPMT